MGGYGGSYYNQYPGSSSFYGGSNTGGYYNRPGSSSYGSGYGGSYGSNYGGAGGYFWNAGQKQHVSMFTIFVSSLLALVVCFITA